MSDWTTETTAKLQAPFNEKFRIHEEYTQQQVIEGGEFLPEVPPSYFPDAVYEQRIDEVFGLAWEVKVDGSNWAITIQVSRTKTVTRVGSSFQEACKRFGVGRYLDLIEDE